MDCGKELLSVADMQYVNKNNPGLKRQGRLSVRKKGFAFYLAEGAGATKAGFSLGSLFSFMGRNEKPVLECPYSAVSGARIIRIQMIKPALEISLKNDKPVVFISRGGKLDEEQLEEALRLIRSGIG